MTCLAPPGYYCAPLDGTVLLCQANRYCPGGVQPPRLCPSNQWSPVGTVSIDGCQENMDSLFAVTVSLILVFLAIFLGVSLCYAALTPAPAYPPPVCRIPYATGEAKPLLDPWRPVYVTRPPPPYV